MANGKDNAKSKNAKREAVADDSAVGEKAFGEDAFNAGSNGGGKPDDYSLESILAEYKGSAFINGEKKTPPELLKEQADRIVMEALGKTGGAPAEPGTTVRRDTPAEPGMTAGRGAPAESAATAGRDAPAGPGTTAGRGAPAEPGTTVRRGAQVRTGDPIMNEDTPNNIAPVRVDAAEIGAADIDAAEAAEVKIDAANIDAPFSGSAEIDAADIARAEAAGAETAAAEAGTAEIDADEADDAVAGRYRWEPPGARVSYRWVDRAAHTGDGAAAPSAYDADEWALPAAFESGAWTPPASWNNAKTDDAGESAPGGDAAAPGKRPDSVVSFFDDYEPTGPEPQDSIVWDVEKAVEREISYGEGPGGYTDIDQMLKDFEYNDYGTSDNRSPGFFEADERNMFAEEEEFTEDEPPVEPELKDAAAKFAAAYGSVTLRCIPAAIITLIMIILTFAYEAGMILPFHIGRSEGAAAGALVIALLAVMMLCVDLVVRGADNLVHGALNIETLILFSCVFSLASGAYAIVNEPSGILPYCAVSALSLTCAAFGERYNLRAIAETLKTASGSAEPFGVQAEYNKELDKSILKKAYNRTDGFYNSLMHPDISESVYRYAVPILLASALVLSVISALAKGQGQYFLRILSAILASSAPFSAMLAFSVPFHTIARSIRKSGAAVAGWGGADDICFTDGACVTDDDLFPSGTLKFNGIKLFGDAPPEKAVRYTASLIVASGSGLSRIFSDALAAQGMKLVRVEDFECYEGGVGALIRGERVMVGSAAFINLLGIRIPDDMNMKNAVFTVVDNQLTAMFAINYVPVNSVNSALVSILRWGVKLYFAVRDFNVTPLMLEQKFRVSLEDIEYIQAKDSYSVSDSNSGNEGRMAAVLTREGFGPFAEAVTGGKLLKSSALIAAAISVVSAAAGVLFMFYMFWSGAFLSAKPGNLILFMLSMLAAVLIVCVYARFRK